MNRGHSFMNPICSTIIGIGSAGLAAITCLRDLGCSRVEIVALDTDPEALYYARAMRKILLNKVWINQSGMCTPPSSMHPAVERDLVRIRDATRKDLVILVSGLGGSTGTRLTPILAREAKNQGALVLVFPIMPFHCEKQITLLRARRGLRNLTASADTVMPFSNQTLADIRDGRSLASRFKILDSLILQTLQGLLGLLGNWGRINLDLADVRAVLSKQRGKTGFIGVCEISDRNVMPQKVLEVFLNPLRPINPKNVDAAVISIACGQTLNLRDINVIIDAVAGEIADDATIKFGVMNDPCLQDTIRVAILGSTLVQKRERKLSPRCPRVYDHDDLVDDKTEHAEDEKSHDANFHH
ncbi:MAG: Cell division protein FtsZ [Promethearchaeota archaeon CR_4]|nr:MAG: Cell division protein FtsZ [Candidatus Lokiarchaeota archaeon CR_4]